MLLQIPHDFFREGGKRTASPCRAPGDYAIGVPVLAARPRGARHRSRRSSTEIVAAEGFPALARMARRARRSERARRKRQADRARSTRQVFIGRGAKPCADEDAFERRLLRPAQGRSPARRLQPQATRAFDGFYTVSMSSRTHRLQGPAARRPARRLFPRPARPEPGDRARPGASALLDQHVPVLAAGASLPLVAHNGEINTLRGNVNWMAARQASVASELFGKDINQALADLLRGPVRHGLFRQRARIPRAGRLFARPCDDDADPGGLGRQPADGRGAPRLLRISCLDDGAVGRSRRRWPSPTAARSARRSTATALRPARYLVTDDGLVVMASEAGVLPIPEEKIVTRSGACSPARCCWSTSSRAASSPTPR